MIRGRDQLDPSLKKHRATACVDLAEAYVMDRKLDEGAAHAINALGIVTGTRHADTLRRVTALHASLRATDAETLRQLGDRLLELKAAS